MRKMLRPRRGDIGVTPWLPQCYFRARNLCSIRSESKGSILGPWVHVTSTTPNSGSVNGGTTITINGDDFIKGAVVRIGSTLCNTIIVLNESTITATTPAHALGSADVVVTNPDGQSSSASTYTYH